MIGGVRTEDFPTAGHCGIRAQVILLRTSLVIVIREDGWLDDCADLLLPQAVVVVLVAGEDACEGLQLLLRLLCVRLVLRDRAQCL